MAINDPHSYGLLENDLKVRRWPPSSLQGDASDARACAGHCCGGLGTIEQVPEYQRRPHIISGYRMHTMGWRKCLASTIALHNETANIWTHLLGVPIVLRWGVFALAGTTFQFEEVLLMLLYVVTLICLLLSANYHIRHCDEEDACLCCFFFDIGGVALLLVASLGIGVSIGFRCFPWAMSAYLLCLLAMGAVLVAAVAWPGTSDETRTKVFVCCGLLGCVPAVHWVVAAPREGVVLMVPYILGVLVCYVGGAVVFISRMPERRWPGRFDYFGQSHNIWHLCVLVGMLVWLDGIERIVTLNMPERSAEFSA